MSDADACPVQLRHDVGRVAREEQNVHKVKNCISICPSAALRPPLPDGLFSNQKFLFGNILENLGMEIVDIIYSFGILSFGIFCIIYGSLESLWSFGIFFPFWYVWTKKNLATRPE
jgi:hypothetical protein